MDEKRPYIVMSGHIHEERGKLTIENSLFFNPGPAKDGYFAILKLDDDKINLDLLKR